MWIELADTCHLFRDKTHLQTGNTSSQWSPDFTSSYAIHAECSIYCLPNLKDAINTTIIRFYRIFTTTTMDTADYWPMAWEYSIWNAAIASLQFWTEDLDPVTLGIATKHVYTTFFYTSTSHTLCQQLLLADEGYKSDSDTIDLPNPL